MQIQKQNDAAGEVIKTQKCANGGCERQHIIILFPSQKSGMNMQGISR